MIPVGANPFVSAALGAAGLDQVPGTGGGGFGLDNSSRAISESGPISTGGIHIGVPTRPANVFNLGLIIAGAVGVVWLLRRK